MCFSKFFLRNSFSIAPHAAKMENSFIWVIASPRFHIIISSPWIHQTEAHLTVHELSLHFTRIGMVDHRQVILFARCLVSSSLAAPLHLLLGSEEMLSINGQ
jgi:hypothetical protein